MSVAADLAYTPAVAEATASIYERMRRVVPAVEWPFHAPLIHAINTLKRERNAVILAHNYQTPEIFHGVADIVGDSLALAWQAASTDADVIVMAGVHFMAETAKLLNPEKLVLIPSVSAGCSLADSITGADIRLLKQKYPGVPVVTYVNTSADVKAESDICCTSGNAVQVVESLGVDRVLFLPDEYLAKYVATQTKVEIWAGTRSIRGAARQRSEGPVAARRSYRGHETLAPLLALVLIPIPSTAHADGCPPASCGTTSVAPLGSKLAFVFPNGRQGPLPGLRPGLGPQAVRPSERHALRRRQGLRLSGSGREIHKLCSLRHANGSRTASPNRPGILDGRRHLGRRSPDRPLQVPQPCASDDLHAGRSGTVGLRPPPRNVPARFPVTAASLPRPLGSHRPL